MAIPAIQVHQQVMDDSGNPQAGAKVYFIEPGQAFSEANEKDTYTTAAGDVVAPNPVIADAGGFIYTWLGAGSYDVYYKTSADVLLRTDLAVPGSTGDPNAGVLTISVDTIADLKALTVPLVATIVDVGGYYAQGDGGGGRFYYNTSSTEAQNNGTIIRPDSAPGTGRWIRNYSGAVSVRWFGAKGDGSTNDYTAINNTNIWVQALPDLSGGDLYFPTGEYVFGTTIVFGSLVRVTKEKGAFLTASTPLTVTFDGSFDLGNDKFFGDDITVTFGSGYTSQRFLPQWWGAKGDGVTIDTDAIQKAIDALASTVGAANGGGVVYFSPGIYISGKLTVTSNFISMSGDGATPSEIRSNGTITELISYIPGGTAPAAGNGQFFIENLKLTEVGASVSNAMLLIENTSWFKVRNIWIEAGATCAAALKVSSSLVGTFNDINVRGGIVAIDVDQKAGYSTPPNSLIFQNATVNSATDWGVRAIGVAMFRFLNSVIEVNGDTNDVDHGGMYLDNMSQNGEGPGAVIDNVWFENNNGVHIKIGYHGFAPGEPIISNCLGVSGTRAYGIYGVTPSGGNFGSATIINTSMQSASTYDFFADTGFTMKIKNCTSTTQSLSVKSYAIPLPATPTQCKMTADILAYLPLDITDNATTLAGQNGGPFYNASNTVPTVLATATGCKDGNTLTFRATNGNTTIKHRSTGTDVADEFDCPGGQDFLIPTRGTISFLRSAGHWYCTGASSPSNNDRKISGTYTATITCTTSGTITVDASFNTLGYEVDGKRVTIFGEIRTSAVNLPVGAVEINLPSGFANGTGTQNSHRSMGICSAVSLGTYTSQITTWMTQTSTNFTLLYMNAGTATSVNAADFTGNEELTFNMTYFTD